jgi:hypothetical protein
MKRTLTALSAIAVVVGWTAFGQAEDVELNEAVYEQGLSQLVADGYDVIQVDQDEAGNLSFSAHDGQNGRILVLDANGAVVSDGPAQVDTGEDIYARATPLLNTASDGTLAATDAKAAVDPKTALEEEEGIDGNLLKEASTQ